MRIRKTTALRYLIAAFGMNVAQGQIIYNYETPATGSTLEGQFALDGADTDPGTGISVDTVTYAPDSTLQVVSDTENPGGTGYRNLFRIDMNGATNTAQRDELQQITADGPWQISFDVRLDTADVTWVLIGTAINSQFDGPGIGGFTRKADAYSGFFPGSGVVDLGTITVRSSEFDSTWNPNSNWFNLTFFVNADTGTNIDLWFDNIEISAIPEPSTYLAASGFGLIFALFCIRRLRQRRAG